MAEREQIIETIEGAFAGNDYPGDLFLQGSFDGEEPTEVARAFTGKNSWQALDAGFLDGVPEALAFLSEAAFRFYLPAYLIADLHQELVHVDVLFHLTHGFDEASAEIEVGGEKFIRRFGRSALVNPRRYGAMTWHDYGRYRLSIFTREEAGAIVAYLDYKREVDDSGVDRDAIEVAVSTFWRERAAGAPSAADLKQHLEQEARFVKAASGGGNI